MKRPQPFDHLFRPLDGPGIFIFVCDLIDDPLHILYFNSAERIIEQQIKVEFERAGPPIRLEPEGLDLVQPRPQLAAEMLAQLRREVEADQFDQMDVDLIIKAQDDVLDQLSRIGQDFCFVEFHRSLPAPPQNSPVMRPSSVRSMLLAAGTRGRPGIVMISPHTATMNSAPADRRISRTARTWSSGAPLALGSVVKLYWVLAMHTGKWPNPAFCSSSRRFSMAPSQAMSRAR